MIQLDFKFTILYYSHNGHNNVVFKYNYEFALKPLILPLIETYL